MTEPLFDPAAMLAVLGEADVRFVLIGGMAAVLHGDVGVTIDIDIAPDYELDNLEKLAAALRALDAHPRRRRSEELARVLACTASELGRWEFPFTAAPHVVPNGAGAAMNPIAVF